MASGEEATPTGTPATFVDLGHAGTSFFVHPFDIPRLAQSYTTGYLAESVFQHFVSLSEDFVFSLLQIWLTTHPLDIPNEEAKSVDLATVLEAPDKGGIVQAIVDRD